MKIKNIIIIGIVATGLSFSSCEDFLTTNPSVDMSDDVVLSNQAGLQMLLNGTYQYMKNGVDDLHATSPVGLKSYSTGVGSIDISSYPGAGNEIYAANRFLESSFMSDGRFPRTFYQKYYEIINNTNLLIANYQNAVEVKVGEQIKGQALIIRARCYYNLVRLYQHTYIIAKDKQGVPLYLDPSNSATEPKSRSTVEEVYTQIEKDLLEAVELLRDFTRPDWTYYNADVAHFLLADMYLTKNQWDKAKIMAQQITSKYPVMTGEQYKKGFCEKNEEWILGYKQTDDDNWYYNSIGSVWYWEVGSQWNGKMFYPTKEFVENVLTPSDDRFLARKITAQPDWYISDKFNDRWLGGQPVLSDMCDLRAAEMYLVEAEAHARLGQNADALTILNKLQLLRNAKLTVASDNMLDAVLLERRKELYGEGFELWDVKRLQLGIKRVEDSANGGHYYAVDIPANSNKLVLQIPRYEMINNPNIEQNPDPARVPVYVP